MYFQALGMDRHVLKSNYHHVSSAASLWRCELFPSKCAAGSKVIFDPRPQSLREADPNALEDLRCDRRILALQHSKELI